LACGSDDIFLIPTKDRGHTGCGDGGGFSHCLAALANKDHCLLCSKDTCTDGRGYFANRVASARAN
jgi:hypothetical protein